jgi:cytidine deaminase
VINLNKLELFKLAHNNLKNSYSSYSEFKVSAVIELNDGSFIKGVNVENASYGLSNCAERSALFAAYSQGYRAKDIKAMIITTSKNEFISPCGACRQVMNELMDDATPVILANNKGDMQEYLNKDFLPYAFKKEDL